MAYLERFGLPFLGLILLLNFKESTGQGYKAAVVAYTPTNDVSRKIVNRNCERYIEIIEDFKNKVDIVVFPEDGLTSIQTKSALKSHLEAYSTYVPNPTTDINFKDTNLAKLNSAAKRNEIYIVINLLEMSNSTNDNKEYYSTDVVFDPDGKIIAKCRKKYLYNDLHYDKGSVSQSCTFEAKFRRINRSVKFALLFDTDLLVGIPDKTTYDAILTSSLPNRLPLSFGLSLQVGFSVRNQVNLLCSGYTQVSQGYGGTGIYLRDGTSTVTLNSDTFLVKEVPLDQNKRDVVDVKVTPSSVIGPITVMYDKLSTLETNNISISKHFDDGGSFCQSHISTNGNTLGPYKWVAYKYDTNIVGQNKTGIICMLIKPKESESLKEIVNNASVVVTSNTKYIDQVLPLSLGVRADSSMVPASFEYKEENKEDITIVRMKLTEQTDLSVFGILLVYKDGVSYGTSIHVSHMPLMALLPVLAFLWSKFVI